MSCFLQHYDDYRASVVVQNSLLKTQLYSAATPATNKPGLAAPALANILNQDPKFLKPYGGSFGDYRLGSTSPARQRPSPWARCPPATC